MPSGEPAREGRVAIRLALAPSGPPSRAVQVTVTVGPVSRSARLRRGPFRVRLSTVRLARGPGPACARFLISTVSLRWYFFGTARQRAQFLSSSCLCDSSGFHCDGLGHVGRRGGGCASDRQERTPPTFFHHLFPLENCGLFQSTKNK